MNSSGNLRKIHSAYQKFGSGSTRFSSSKKQIPGPGSYNLINNSFTSLTELKAPFASTDSRFASKPSISPGPGTYLDRRYSESQKRAHNKDSAFGSGEKRFIEKIKKKAPGPGQYDWENRIGLHNSMNRNELSSFSSKVLKGNKVINAENPPPGKYEIPSAFDKKRHPNVQPVLVRINIGLDKILGFNARDERFKEINNDIPGPGSYNKKKRHNEVKKRAYTSKEERFLKKDDNSPGPGTYIDGKNHWNKKTFNIKFTESDE